jgi:hypothetical protein
MPTDLSQCSPSREDAVIALGELRTCCGELRGFVAAVFDRLDDLIGQLKTEDAARQESQHQTDHEAVQTQIDQLARLAGELSRSVAELSTRRDAQREEAEA